MTIPARTEIGSPRRSSFHASALLLAAGLLAYCASNEPPAPARASSPSPAPPTFVPSDGARSVPPQALAGNWLLEVRVGSRTLEGGLHFTNTNGVLVGTWTSAEGNEFELTKIAISGDQVSWDVDGPSGSQHATGTIDGLSMKGTMKRTGKREGRGSSADSEGEASPTGESAESPPSGSGGRTGGGHGGRGGGRRLGSGRSGGGGGITWTAYKTISAAPAAPVAPTPTPAASGARPE
ncbi:MAG: hypothetical protein ABI592_01180 [Acidobacteriota bacterium]